MPPVVGKAGSMYSGSMLSGVALSYGVKVVLCGCSHHGKAGGQKSLNVRQESSHVEGIPGGGAKGLKNGNDASPMPPPGPCRGHHWMQ